MPQDRIITSSVNISAVPAASGQTINSPTFGGVATFNNTPSLPGINLTSLPVFADNSAASPSLSAGALYRASGSGSPVAGTLMIKF